MAGYKAMNKLLDKFDKCKTNEGRCHYLTLVSEMLKSKEWYEAGMQYIVAYNAMYRPTPFNCRLYVEMTGKDAKFLAMHGASYYFKKQTKAYKNKCNVNYMCVLQRYLDRLDKACLGETKIAS